MSRHAGLQAWSMPELVHELARQQWQGVSTWGTGICGHPARGCGFCADCLLAEIERRKLPEVVSAEGAG